MPAGYSSDLRERVVDAVEKGASRRGAAGTPLALKLSSRQWCAAQGEVNAE